MSWRDRKTGVRIHAPTAAYTTEAVAHGDETKTCRICGRELTCRRIVKGVIVSHGEMVLYVPRSTLGYTCKAHSNYWRDDERPQVFP